MHPDSDLGGYTLIVAPALTLMTPERAAHLEAAAQHARVVFGPRTAFRTVSGRTPEAGQFGPLAGLVGASLQNFESLPAGLTQMVGAHTAYHWAEFYALNGAEALYSYMGGPLYGQAAVIRRGLVTVIGAHSETLIAGVLEAELRALGLPLLHLPEGVRVSRRGGVTLLQNWRAEPVRWQGRDYDPVSSTVLRQQEVSV